MSQDDSSKGVRTTKTLFEIVEFIKDEEQATLTEIANELDFAKSTVHRHVTTLESLGYLVKGPDGYYLGIKFLNLGRNAREDRPEFNPIRRKIDELASITDERALFSVIESGDLFLMYESIGEKGIETTPGIGHPLPIYATAGGKAILSEMSEDQVFELIESREIEQLSQNTVSDADELVKELEEIQDMGFSQNKEENFEGIRAVGTSVKDNNANVVGAISITGPKERMKGARFNEDLPNLLLEAANEIEINIYQINK